MKIDKKKIKDAFLEGLIEIVLSLICFGIGALIISAFGVKLNSLNFDLIILLGVIVFIFCFCDCICISTMVQEINQRQTKINNLSLL